MQLKDYLSAISRRWWIVVLVIVSATVCSFVFSKLQTPVYRSTVIFMNTSRLDWGTTMTVQVLLQQQDEELHTLSLASKVNDRMQLDLSPQQILSMIKTKTYNDSISVQLDVEDANPDRARKIALGYGEVFQEQKAAEYAQVAPENRVLVTMLEDPSMGILIRPNTKMNTAAGAILGLILGLAIVVALEYLDDSIRTPEDVARYLDVPILGLIPTVPSK